MSEIPPFEKRSQSAFEAELRARARAWLPEWQPRREREDFLAAIFSIAARFSAEVAQRLDRVPEKNFRGFLHWLGVRGEAGRAARVPVAVTMTAGAEAIDATPPVQLQALATDPPVVFETVEAFTITPAALVALVAADAGTDSYYESPPGVLSLDPPAAVPTQWSVVEDAQAGSTVLQLDPTLGLEPGTIISSEEQPPQRYQVVKPEGSLVEVTPAIGTRAGIRKGSVLRRVERFDPFGGTRDAQEHAIYIGANAALDLPSKAVIHLDGWSKLVLDSDIEWSYWGKRDDPDEAQWIPLKLHPGDELVLLKDAGKVEEKQIAGRRSRWLRAHRRKSDLVSTLGPVQLRINCVEADSGLKGFMEREPSPITVEAVANTAPLVLNAPFYPFGREPRLFDAFYVGSKEALSKANARVTLDFTMANDWQSRLVGVTSASGSSAVFGIDAGGSLRIVHFKAGQSIAETFAPTTQPKDSEGKLIALQPAAGLGAAVSVDTLYISAIADDGQCWSWSAPVTNLSAGAWKALGGPQSVTSLTQTAIRSGTAGLEVVLVADRRVYLRDFAGTRAWLALNATIGQADVDFACIAPFVDPQAAAGAPPSSELVAVSSIGELYFYDSLNAWRRVKPEHAPFDPEGEPLAVRTGAASVRIWGVAQPEQELSVLLALEIVVRQRELRVSITRQQELEITGKRVVPVEGGSGSRVAFVTRQNSEVRPGQWDVFATPEEPAVQFDMPSGNSVASGAPVRFGTWLALPTQKGHLWVAPLAAADHQSVSVHLHSALIVPAASIPDSKAHYVVVLDASREHVRHIVPLADGRHALILRKSAPDPAQGSPFELHQEAATSVAVELQTPQTLLIPTAEAPDEHSLVVVHWEAGASAQSRSRVFEVLDVSPAQAMVGESVVTLDDSIPGTPANLKLAKLQLLTQSAAFVRPAFFFQDAQLAEHATLIFPDLKPQVQRAISTASTLKWLVLEHAWTKQPSASSASLMLLDATFEKLEELQPSRPRNPDLSWEYWDGSAWWQIEDVSDTTGRLITTGKVSFCMPANVAATDVVGRNNFWIRARLVGGNYGQEKITLFSKPVNGGTEQTIDRNTDDIRAPYVVMLKVSYAVCCPIVPDLVLTGDGGEVVDQSAANRQSGAVLEAFVPIGHAIDGSHAGARAGRALYVGFYPALQGEPISLLFRVREGQHDAAFPLRVEALRAQRFEPLLSVDGTRGLNETGTLRISLAEPPVQANLFGRSVFWLRLRPREGFPDEQWQPTVLGAYVNATWAEATETQLGELLGSSDGRPNLVVTLSRRPVVAGSLRLRVREGLSAEQITELRLVNGDDAVVDAIGTRQGPWVLWREVPDLLDVDGADRVFTFADDTGTITFGDGIHGMIPPVGLDAIIADKYVRGGGALANGVDAFSEVNLITPLAGVDRVVLPERAAGGSDPESAERTLRFAPAKLRQRTRIITLADLESAAVESSPDIVQACARPRRDGVDLFVVMRGPEPQPSARVRRELERHLRERVAPHLALPGVLIVQAPGIVHVEIEVPVVVSSIDQIATVASECARRIRKLLDPQVGGLDQLGWPLGRWPDDVEIAACLDGVEKIEQLDPITVTRVGATGTRALRAHELVCLGPDDVAVRATVAEDA